MKDLTGQRFGALEVLRPTEKRSEKGSVIWLCRCDCGKEVEFSSRQLLHQKIVDCGCSGLHSRMRDLTGQRYGQLTALYPTPNRSSKGLVIWHCRCDCGKEMDVESSRLLNGTVTSCGCGGLNRRINNLTGQKFGLLTVLYPTDQRTARGSVIWRCRCDCGRELDCTSVQLSQGKVLNCGCQKDHTAGPQDRLIQKKKEYGSADEENGGK